MIPSFSGLGTFFLLLKTARSKGSFPKHLHNQPITDFVQTGLRSPPYNSLLFCFLSGMAVSNFPCSRNTSILPGPQIVNIFPLGEFLITLIWFQEDNVVIVIQYWNGLNEDTCPSRSRWLISGTTGHNPSYVICNKRPPYSDTVTPVFYVPFRYVSRPKSCLVGCRARQDL